MNAIEQLKSVLCDHTGKCSVIGSDEDRAIVDRALQTLAAPTVQDLPFGVGGGLVAIKTLLGRDPCVHANTAIGMIDAILKEHTAAQPAVPLTDDQIRGLTPKPDGVAEAGVRRVEVLPGVMGTEFDEVDAWSMPLVLQIARAIEAAHGITAAPEKGQP